MRHTLQSIYVCIQSPTPSTNQVRAPGQGPRAGRVRDLGQQVRNRISGRNARYLERNGLLAMTLLSKRLPKMVPHETMGGMIEFSDAQWFFNVRGVLQHGTFTMSAPIDYYQGIPADSTRVFALPCPQDVAPLVRRELAKHGRILPTFLDFLRRNPAIVQHYNINMMTGMPFVNEHVVVSPEITALPIVAVAAPIIAPTTIAPTAIAPVVIAPAAIAPLSSAHIMTAAVATAAVPAAQPISSKMVPPEQHTIAGPTQARPQKRGRDDEEDDLVADNKKLKMGAPPHDPFFKSATLTSQMASYSNSQQSESQWQDYGVAAHQSGNDSHLFSAPSGSTLAAVEYTQQSTLNNDSPFLHSVFRSCDIGSDGFQFYVGETLDRPFDTPSSGGISSNSPFTHLTVPETMEPPIVFDGFEDALNGSGPNSDFTGLDRNVVDNGLTKSFEYDPDIPLPAHYFQSILPPANEQDAFVYQGYDGFGGGELMQEEDAGAGFTLEEEEVEDNGLFDIF